MARKKKDPIDAVVDGFTALDSAQQAITLAIIRRLTPTMEQVAAVTRPRKPKVQPEPSSL